jgi:hypothetical protein
MSKLLSASVLVVAVTTGFAIAMDRGVPGSVAQHLVSQYNRADEQRSGKPWKPPQKDVRAARQLLAKRGAPDATKAAAAYCLAMSNTDAEGNTARMVSCAMRTVDAETEWEDAATGLGDALYAIVLRTRAKAAFRALASIWLDGGPGECLGNVRAQAFEAFPSDLAAAWKRLPLKQRRNLVEDLSGYTDLDDSLIGALRSARHSTDAAVRELATETLRDVAANSGT